MPIFRPATILDANALLERGVRAADQSECWKMTGATVDELLRESVDKSACVAAAEYNGNVIALFGVAPLLLFPLLMGKYMGLVWLVGHDDFDRPGLAVPLGRASQLFVDCWQREYELLGNFVDPENKTSLRWLKWLGFNIDARLPLRGPQGHTLYRFWKRRA